MEQFQQRRESLAAPILKRMSTVRWAPEGGGTLWGFGQVEGKGARDRSVNCDENPTRKVGVRGQLGGDGLTKRIRERTRK